MHCLLQKNINPTANNFKWIVNLLNLLLQRSGVLALSPPCQISDMLSKVRWEEVNVITETRCDVSPRLRLRSEAPGTCHHLTCVHMSTPTFVTHVGSEGASGETVWLTLIWLLRPDGPGTRANKKSTVKIICLAPVWLLQGWMRWEKG